MPPLAAALVRMSSQAFFAVGPDLRLKEPISLEAERLLGSPLAGQDVAPLLFSRAQDQADFSQGLALVLEGKAHPEVVFDLLGEEFEVKERRLRPQFQLLDPQSLLIVLTDVTRERRFQEISRKDLERRFMVLKAVTHKSYFAGFVRGAGQLFTELARLEERAPSEAALQALLRQLHTFRAEAAFLDFHQTATRAFAFETSLADSLALNEDPRLHAWALDMKKDYYSELRLITGILGEDWTWLAEGVVFPRQEYLRLEGWVARRHPQEKALLDWLAAKRSEPFRSLFAPYPVLAAEIAEREGKRLHPFLIEGGTQPVPTHLYEGLAKAFAHLVRNALDHGLEFPAEREAVGKDPAGTLRLNLQHDPSGLRLQFSDDGRGVDAARVEARARELGLLASGQSLSSAQLLQFLFHQGFSTREEVSALSGRGVGLAALRQEVKALGGSITVQSRPGRGTTFDIALPHPDRRPL